MFNTKLEVDKHVETCLKNINNDTERNLRCFAFARLYFKVGDYEQARRYVSNYLIAKPLSAEALSFLGKALEKQGKVEAAVDAYRRSLDVDPKQNSLLLKVCDLLCSDAIPIDIPSLQYYCEKAQKFDPQNPIVYNLKERLVAAKSQDPNDVLKLLLTELESRSTDVQLRVRLLWHLLQNNQVKEAYKHASDIEWKSIPIFFNSLSWYEVMSEVLLRYQRENVTVSNLTWEFWMLFVTVLDKLAALTLDEHFNNVKSSSEYTAAVFNLDQTLTIAAKSVSDCTERPLVQEFLSHYRAQLCFHLSTLLFKQAKSDLIKYKDALNMSLPLLFIAFHTQPVELNCLWLDHSPEIYRLQVQKWHREASFRCSQVGHILLSAAKDRKIVIMEKFAQHSSGLWREQLFKKLFITRDEQHKMKSSYFVTCQQFVDIPSQLPDVTDMIKYDEYAQSMHPDSLHNLVWICMNKKLSTFKCTVFEGLQYSVKNLNSCSAESLNVLDIESFVYLTALSAHGRDDNKMYYNGDKPPLIPASITDQLGTLNQAKWFKAAYKVYKNMYGGNLSEMRLNLIKGIEIVRCVGNHGIDVKLLVTLANTFMERAKKLTKQSEIEFNDARAELYWKAALPILEKLQKNQAVSYGINRLFDYKHKDLSQFEISKYIDDARLFNGIQLMKKKEFEKALHIFDGLKNPYATYYQAQIYKTMAEEQLNQNKENVTSEMRSQHVILLSRSRDCLYLTLDRLRDPSVDRKHPLNKQLGSDIEKIERLLSRIDSDIYVRNDCDGLSDENVSSAGSIGDHANNFYSSSLYPNESLTPHLDKTTYSSRYRLELPNRREARPSPERLDAQLRQMQASRDATLSHIMEQNRLMVDSHRSLMEEFRWLKEAVGNVTTSVSDLQNIKDSISELKNVVEDLQSMRNVTDLLQEMKKEIAELKKDQAKSKNQLSEEDLYVLDDEYTGDYGINANATGFNTNNLYPHYQGRLPLTYPPALYPGMYPVYPYAGLGLPQGSLPFAQDSQIPEYPQLKPPPGLTQPTYGQHLPQAKPSWDVTHHNLAQINLMQPVIVPQLQPPSTQTNIFRDTTATASAFSGSVSSNIFSSVTTTLSSTEAPVNVVITTSDPLPKTTVTTTQVLSVTIPPQHLKGNVSKTTQAHNYQIPLPATYSNLLNTTPTIINQPSPVSLGLQIEKSLNQSFNANTSDTNKAKLSSSATEETDPCPNFKPIIPLPDEVPVKTGEENESVIFSNRAKLFRFVNTEWKERGIGVLKILEDKDTKKIRILMRRDEIHKICANHFITKDMNVRRLDAKPNLIWAANDYSDQQFVIEKFCARFKNEEIANEFLAAVEQCKKKLPEIVIPVEKTKLEKTDNPEPQDKSPSLGGFIFTSTPTFKPKEAATPVKDAVTAEPIKNNSPFASFTFGAKTSTPANKLFPSHEEKDTGFEPTAEFKPVVPLPDLIDVKTGEENAEILFECHAKLLKYDTPSKEWKECGVGIMKLLKERTIRLVMRRDQVLKVCCNHQLLKKMQFAKMPKHSKAFSWCAQDFSDGSLQTEIFTIRFKSEEQADAFSKAVTSAQLLLDENNVVKSDEKVAILEIKDDTETEAKGKEDKKVKGEPAEAVKVIGFGDKFKPKAGSWKCKVCFIHNEGKDQLCVACETPKNTTPKKTPEPVFSFGVPSPVSSSPAIDKSQFSFGTPSSTAASTSFVFAQKPVSWGDAFKAKEGSWECPNCYLRNDGDLNKCQACQHAKDPEKKVEPPFSSCFDKFKPKEGSWECKSCLIRNDADKVYCIACDNPKDDTVPKKENTLGTGGVQFKFGIPSVVATTSSTSFSFTTPAATSFSFGSNTSTSVTEIKFGIPSTDESKDRFVFGSPQQHAFEFTPRSPRRHSSGCQGEEESDSFVEDDGDHIYFKPVVSLPDKIDVKTGEESEQVLYCHRAKLFRFVDGEWKERGIGDLKILLNSAAKKLRVLMRREQVLKICLNHSLTEKIEYMPKDDKTWLFTAPDYSEGEINHWQFCVRFKTPEVAQEFKKAVEDALKTYSSASTDASKSDNAVSENEVEFMSETQVTPEEEQEAIRLKLPPKFMSYRQLPDCSCDICKEDDVILKELLKKSNSNDVATSNDKFIFGKPSTPITAAPTTPNSKFILAKPKLFLSPESPKTETNAFKTFSFSLKTETETTTTPAVTTTTSSTLSTPKFPFGSISFTSPSTSGGSIFNDIKPKNIFGTTENIFGGNEITDATKNTFTAPQPTESKQDESSLTFVKKFEVKPFTKIDLEAPDFASLAKKSEKATEKKIHSSDKGKETGKESGSNNEYRYQPIVPLPQAAVASTEDKSKSKNNLEDLLKTKNLFNTNFSLTSQAKGDQVDPKKESMLTCDSDLTFTNVSNSAPNIPVFGKKFEEGDNPFAHLGSGAPVFASLAKHTQKKKEKASSDHEGDDSGNEVADNYDPHYEPIVPLPDAIVVSTGEENEVPVFNERAKLYRYDDKEWKERGVGQMKILHHSENGTYRFILRREQVHKVVLNMLITPNLELQPMATSDRAWLWGGYNHLDEGAQLEKLAAKFKSIEQANTFQKVVEAAIVSVKEHRDKNLPSTIQNFDARDASDDHSAGRDDEVDEEEDEEDCEEEEEERAVLFMKPCQLLEENESGQWNDLASGDIIIYYDPDICVSRIYMCDESGTEISNTTIGADTEMMIEDNACVWKAMEWADGNPRWHSLKAVFSTYQDAEEFHCRYVESLQFAQESEIVDQLFTEGGE
ncbi:hypothetical protein RN001_015428 [Aquatica leii]|uniref:E3 SUMO-protein ligase RanBP2 n=1 Tax=Aquatica leii TaxID=1421715 RepID=A0AAN7NZ59_9COLE|nr:hypothetical protein RN001_015428 [Aquatica leii]